MAALPPYITKLVIESVTKAAIKTIPKAIKILKDDDNSKVIAFEESLNNKSAIIFVHGFSGSPTETFKNVPELLRNDDNLNGYDIISVGYSSRLVPDIGAGIWSSDPDINNLSEYFKTLLKIQFNKYERICIVAHSMGGLIVQNAILKLSDMNLQKITHLLMFGTPSGGLKIADNFAVRWFKRHIRNMGSKSDFILRLRADWKTKFNGNYPFEFKAVAGVSDEFVKRYSSLEVFEERYRYQIGGNHATMVKAENEHDIKNQCFSLILNDLTPATRLQGDPYALNQIMAENEGKVNLLKPIAEANEIDARGLKNLALALDVLGRDEEAIAILEANDLHKTHSDTMGIIGGRYKRKYLFSGSKKSDAENAIKYYSAGLNIAKKKKRADQIYYHAINLAFLSLMYNDDRTEMKKYASLAIDNCQEETNNIWEVATLAEAYLYLENKEKSETYYKKVLDITNNRIRERSSIFINAKFAYEELNS